MRNKCSARDSRIELHMLHKWQKVLHLSIVSIPSRLEQHRQTSRRTNQVRNMGRYVVGDDQVGFGLPCNNGLGNLPVQI